MPDDDDLESRRSQLEERLSSLRQDGTDSDSDSTPVSDSDSDSRQQGKGKGIGFALSLSSGFIAAILVGAVLGWLLDELLGSSPFGLIIFLLLGFCAGILNIMRSAGMISRSPLNFEDASHRDDSNSGDKDG